MPLITFMVSLSPHSHYLQDSHYITAQGKLEGLGPSCLRLQLLYHLVANLPRQKNAVERMKLTKMNLSLCTPFLWEKRDLLFLNAPLLASSPWYIAEKSAILAHSRCDSSSITLSDAPSSATPLSRQQLLKLPHVCFVLHGEGCGIAGWFPALPRQVWLLLHPLQCLWTLIFLQVSSFVWQVTW